MSRDFVGSTANYLQINDNGPSDITGTAMSVHAWVQPDLITGRRCVFGKYNGTASNQFFFNVSLGKADLEINDGVGVDTATGATVMTVGQWYAIGGRKNGTGAGALAAFLNGNLDASITSNRSIHAGTSPIFLGSYATGTAGNCFDGRIAECAIWDVALSNAEFAALAKGVCPLAIRRDHLKGYWPLFGVAYPEPDLSGGGGAHIVFQVGAIAAASHPPVQPWASVVA